MLCFFFFACCFAQEEKIFGLGDNLFPREEIMDFDSEPEDVHNVEKILIKLSSMLNKDLQQTISKIIGEMVNMKEKMADMMDKMAEMSVIKEKMDAMGEMKEKIVQLKEWIDENSETISNVNSTISDLVSVAKKNSAQLEQQGSRIESLTSSDQQHETKIVNNIQRLNSMTNKIGDMGQIRENIEKNSVIISVVNSTAERNSAQISSMSEEVEQQEKTLEHLSSSEQQQETRIQNNIKRLDSLAIWAYFGIWCAYKNSWDTAHDTISSPSQAPT